MMMSPVRAFASRHEPSPNRPIRVGFVLHVMQVAGAEVLVAETIRRLAKRVDPVIFCLDAVGALGEQLLAEGCPVVAYQRREGLDFRLPRRMARDIRARRLDVVHAHQYTPFFYGAIAGRLSGVSPRVIFTEHGRHYPDVVSARRRLTNRLVLDRLADDVNAVCEFSAKSLAEKDGFRANRIQIIPNGIDLPRYAPVADRAGLRLRLGLSPLRRYITCVARLHPVKDHRTLLKAFSSIAALRPDVDLLLVGDGPLRSELESRARELGVMDRVHFLGVRQDIPEILRAVDIFALTSVSEAASITLLEAMAAERPVVVTDVGGNPELVRHGIEGLLAPRADPGAISAAFLRILDDPEVARAMGVAGAARVRTHFLLDQTIERYYELYRRAGPGAAAGD
jgi:glycosyltransferase involved in cell wall biosynthesis